jgi:3-dehydroquinate synthase
LRKIVITADGRESVIFVGNKWRDLTRMIPLKNVVIITDDNIRKLYGSSFPEFPVISIKPGEDSKRLKVIEELSENLLDLGIDRTGFVLAIGGGVVCDIAGFLASIFMRGIRVAYVSTSLLSQVDASTGGKNGVNLGNTKNVLGCFTQPEFVICDTSMLLTLPGEEFLSGIAELIKTAVIKDEELFRLIENNTKRIIDRDTHLLSDLVARSVEIKAAVVTEDEKETGLRRILNFGHTYGHAIEMYTSVRHGFAVASGMELAVGFSFRKGMINEKERGRIIRLLNDFGLIVKHSIPDDLIRSFIMHDKKKSGSDIHFVFLSGIGRPVVQQIPVEEVVSFYNEIRIK